MYFEKKSLPSPGTESQKFFRDDSPLDRRYPMGGNQYRFKFLLSRLQIARWLSGLPIMAVSPPYK